MKYDIKKIEDAFFKAVPFPPVLYNVILIINEKKEPLYKLGKEIAKDPVLAAKIMAAANSPFYGFKQKVSDLPHAISLLGYDEVSSIILRMLTKKAFSIAARDSILYVPREVWLHSVKVAHISRILVRKYNLPYYTESYMAGLLHDIGKNAIAIFIEPEDEKKILDKIESGLELHEAELEVLGFSHVQCSFDILKKLKISLSLLKPVRKHHDNMTKDFRQLSFILTLANVLAKFEDCSDIQQIDQILDTKFNMKSTEIQDLPKLYQELKIDLEHL